MNYAVFEGYGLDSPVFYTKVGAYRVYKFLQDSGVCLLQETPVINEAPVQKFLAHDEITGLRKQLFIADGELRR